MPFKLPFHYINSTRIHCTNCKQSLHIEQPALKKKFSYKFFLPLKWGRKLEHQQIWHCHMCRGTIIPRRVAAAGWRDVLRRWEAEAKEKEANRKRGVGGDTGLLSEALEDIRR